MTLARRFDLSMARRLLACGCVISLAGCSAPPQLSTAAQTARRAVEQNAGARAAETAAHEMRIFDDEARLPAASRFALGERYYVRPDARGWSVLDRRTRGSAVVGNTAQSGLSYEEATQVAESLRAADRAQWR